MPGTGRLAVLEAYQEVFRLHALELLLVAAIALWGAIAGRGRPRQFGVLLLLTAAYLLLAPVALNAYQARYGVTASTLLVAAAAIGGWAAFDRRAQAAPGAGGRTYTRGP